MARVLTADLGNSRLKLRLFRSPEGARSVLEAGIDLERGEGLPDAAQAWLAQRDGVDLAALCSVVEGADVEALRGLLSQASGGELSVAPDPGIEVRCTAPDQVGRDRLYAARAALALAADEPVCVLDCGTALTVDAACAGAFLGGAIAPGPDLLARSLGEGASRLFAVEPEPLVPALGLDTRSALAAGVVHGLRGAATALAAAVAAEAGLDGPRNLATGGARRFLLQPEPILEGLVEAPDLVHHGLLLALGRSAPGEPA
jgi:type III pantothenate kinase